MKETLLRYVLLAVFATVAVSGYGDGKVDYDKMETLVTNKLVFLSQNVMVHNYLNYVKQQTGATNVDVADCLGRFIMRSASAEPGTKEFSCCRTAIWLFAEISEDRQMKVLADVAERQDNRTACNALYYYYRRMRGKRGLELVERLLEKETLGTNVCCEVSVVLRMDAADGFGRNDGHRTALTAFAKRLLERRKHLKLADSLMLKLDNGYDRSERRRRLAEDVATDRIPDMVDSHRRYFKDALKSMDRREGK